jgi:hypothetical protein
MRYMSLHVCMIDSLQGFSKCVYVLTLPASYYSSYYSKLLWSHIDHQRRSYLMQMIYKIKGGSIVTP